MVPVIFEEVADEQDLYAPRCPQAVIACSAQPIDHIQRMILEGMIIRQTERFGHSAERLRTALECHFGIAEMKKLPCYLFDEALTYLDGIPGVN